MFDYQTHTQAIGQVLAKDLFFIGGTIKSGTTWLQKTMDSHPEVACRGEGHLANFFGTDLYKALKSYNKRVGAKNENIFGEIEGYPLFRVDHFRFLLASAAALLFADYRAGDEIKVIGEKTPDNLVNMRLLSDVFPRAKFVHVIRDGRDVAVSGWFHNLRVSPEWAKKRFGTVDGFASNFAASWVKQINRGREAGAKIPDRYMEIRYEDLHGKTAGELGRLCRFLGVDDGESVISACCKAGSFETLSGGRAPGDEDRNSHFRKGIVGDWTNHLDKNSVKAFEETAGPLLRDLGYDKG